MKTPTSVRLLLPLALLLAGACAGPRAAAPPPVVREAPPPPPLPPRPETRPLPESEARFVEETMGLAEEIRGLAFAKPVEAVEGDPELVRWLVARGVRELKVEGLWDDQVDMLQAFSLVAPDADVEDLFLSLLAEQVRGVYDHRDQTLVVVPGTSMVDDEAQAQLEAAGVGERRMFLFHELVHALQDQAFGLARFMEPSVEEDRGNAQRALVEGDATYAMYDLLFTRLAGRHIWDLPDLAPLREQVAQAVASGEQPELEAAPPYLRGTLLFGYVDGLFFTDALYRQGGWEAVDRAYDAPPTTTEQVLHPDKYLAGEEAIPVTLPRVEALEREGYAAHPAGTLGELGLRLWIETLAGTPPPAEVGRGWGGDRYVVYAHAERPPAVVWKLVFDTPAARDAFLEVATAAVAPEGPFRLAAIGEAGLAVTGHVPEGRVDDVLEALSAE